MKNETDMLSKQYLGLQRKRRVMNATPGLTNLLHMFLKSCSFIIICKNLSSYAKTTTFLYRRFLLNIIPPTKVVADSNSAQ